jgi:hypothetical protein
MTADELRTKAAQEADELLDDLHRQRLSKNYGAMLDLAKAFREIALGWRDFADD